MANELKNENKKISFVLGVRCYEKKIKVDSLLKDLHTRKSSYIN